MTDRREADRDVVEDLGEDPARADEHGRPEHRVALEADDQFHARRGHRLDEDAADVQAGRATRGEQLREARRGRSPHR